MTTAVSVPLTLSSPTVGSVAPTSVTFNGGDMNQTTTFTAANTGNVNPASTTVTAGLPAQGTFVIPGGSANVVTAFVAGAGLTPCNTTVGKSLEALCNITLNGTAAGVLNITLTSNSTNLQLSNTPTGVGQNQITVTVQPGHSLSSDFYVYGLTNTGTATYTASNATLGTVSGTITFAPSGFIISGPNLGVNFSTPQTVNIGVGIFSVLLKPSGDVVGLQNFAGAGSIAVNTSDSASNVGTLSPAQVTILGGTNSAGTTFVSANPGSTTLGVVQPAGFTAPNQFTSVVATVTVRGMTVTPPSTGVGYHLQGQAQVTLGAPAPAGQQITVTSNDPTNLLLSIDPTKPGQTSITLNLNAGDQNAVFNFYGLAASGTPGFTATAAGYTTVVGSVPLTPAAVVIGSGGNFVSNLTTTVAQGSSPLTVATIQLDPNSGVFIGFAPVAGGFSVPVSLNDSNPTVGSIDRTSVTFNGNDIFLTVNFTPLQSGNTAVGITSVPTNFSVYPGFGSVGITVN
jgi:hypothetical protein